MVREERGARDGARWRVGARGAMAPVVLVWAAVACAPGREPPSPQPADAGSEIGEHCAPLRAARVHSPGCDDVAEPGRDGGAPRDARDAAPTDPTPSEPDASGAEAGAGSDETDAGPSSGGDGGGGTAAPHNDCCTASEAPGCNDSAVLACVCEGDAFCCSDVYDSLCVTQAASRCDVDCDERAPVSDCCAPSDVPSCSVPSIAACVCEEDPFCCVFRFDENCVNLAKARCSASCAPEVRR